MRGITGLIGVGAPEGGSGKERSDAKSLSKEIILPVYMSYPLLNYFYTDNITS